MKEYYIHGGRKQKGPFSIEELKEQNISPKTLVWSEGMDKWKKASEVLELTDILKKIPPPLNIKKPPSVYNKWALMSKIFIVLVILLGLFWGIMKLGINTAEENKKITEQKHTNIDTLKVEIEKELETTIKKDYSIYSGTYKYSSHYGFSNVDIKYVGNDKIKFSISTGSVSDCVGSVEGVATISSNGKAYYKKGKCKIAFYFKEELLEVRESGSCSEHGMRCSFTCDVTKFEKKVVDEQKTFFRKNLATYIKPYTNDFNKDLVFGGIWDLYVKIDNKSPFFIEAIGVSVQYYKTNGELHKTEYLSFTNLKPGQQYVLAAPNSSKGTKVVCHISGVRCKILDI